MNCIQTKARNWNMVAGIRDLGQHSGGQYNMCGWIHTASLLNDRGISCTPLDLKNLSNVGSNECATAGELSLIANKFHCIIWVFEINMTTGQLLSGKKSVWENGRANDATFEIYLAWYGTKRSSPPQYINGSPIPDTEMDQGHFVIANPIEIFNGQNYYLGHDPNNQATQIYRSVDDCVVQKANVVPPSAHRIKIDSSVKVNCHDDQYEMDLAIAISQSLVISKSSDDIKHYEPPEQDKDNFQKTWQMSMSSSVSISQDNDDLQKALTLSVSTSISMPISNNRNEDLAMALKVSGAYQKQLAEIALEKYLDKQVDIFMSKFQ